MIQSKYTIQGIDYIFIYNEESINELTLIKNPEYSNYAYIEHELGGFHIHNHKNPIEFEQIDNIKSVNKLNDLPELVEMLLFTNWSYPENLTIVVELFKQLNDDDLIRQLKDALTDCLDGMNFENQIDNPALMQHSKSYYQNLIGSAEKHLKK